jgi:RNA polymerase sigma factor (sigma-70 family)
MDPHKLSAPELVQLCLASQDPAPWLEFVSRFEPLVSRVVLKSLRRWSNPDPATIEDLVQDTFLKLLANDFRALREFEYEHENSLYGFLKTVASHVVQDHIRNTYSQKRGRGRDEEDLETVSATVAATISVTNDPHNRILLNEINSCLQREVQGPNSSRDLAIFWLHYRYGLSATAIAQIPEIGLTVKGVESTLFRLVRLLRDKLAGRGMGSGA